MLCGYGRLIEKFGVHALSHKVSAQSSTSVNRLVRTDAELLVPVRMAPREDDVVGHLAFAIKNEGVNLEVLSQVLPKVDSEALQARIDAKPTGAILRKLGWLWEAFTGKTLNASRVGGNYVELFDRHRYFTGSARRIPRWRVVFNGIGSLAYCPTVRKTALLTDENIVSFFNHLRGQLSSAAPLLLQRALDWAYQSEASSSFEIEKETPTGSKVQRFAELLRKSDQIHSLHADALTNIQNTIVANVLAPEFSYRTTQNWLAIGSRSGASLVTYVPPTPEHLGELMHGLLEIANADHEAVNPLIAAGVCSFGFVYLHPFLDGNGRISRFLIHQQLNRGKLFPAKCVLPVSAVMLKHEYEYLQALEAFSTRCRELWEVINIAPGKYKFAFNGSIANYRYWDATEQCEFLYRMLHEAVMSHMAEELSFLDIYDRIYRKLNQKFDVVQKDLDLLVSSSINAKRVSDHLKKKYRDCVPAEFFTDLDALLAEEFSTDDAPHALKSSSASARHALAFSYAERVFKEKALAFDDAQKRALGLLNADGSFTNLALLLSDQCPHSLKAAVYPRADCNLPFLERQEFFGSLLEQFGLSR